MSDTKQKTGGKRKLLYAGIPVLILPVAVGVIIYMKGTKGAGEMRSDPSFLPQGMGEGTVTAVGTTSVGMQEEIFDLDYIETELVIEEVYLANQDVAEAGTAILKITDDSLKKARRELEEAAQEADIAYRQAVLDGEEEKITVKQTRDTSLTEESYASYTYDNSLKEYEDEIADLQEQIEEAQELLEEYTASVESDYYYTYYEVAEKKEAFETTFAALMELYEEWDVASLQDHNQNTSSAGSTAGGGTGGQMMGAVSEGSSKLSVYEMLDEEVQENEAAYEEAQESYEEAKSLAEASLAQAQSNLLLLQTQLEEAQIAYDKQQVISQSDYDNTLSVGTSAEDNYQMEIDRIEDEISVALNEKEETQENLEEFEALLGDGCLYTQDAGTVMMVSVREESVLSGGSMVLAYSNPDNVTVTAAVDQEDIASLKVGDEATVMFTEYGTYQGTIRSINPVSTSDSRSSVTYSVSVELEGDVSALSQNLSGTVYFSPDTDTQTGGEADETEASE